MIPRDNAAPRVAAATPGDWQAALAEAIVAPRRPAPAGLRTWNGTDARQRLDIYRNNALVPLVQTLEESFPVACALSGRARFRTLAIEFVRAHPPRSPVLQDYGAELPPFLAGRAELRTLPAVAELARLELAFVTSWHAADAAVLQPTDFAGLLADAGRLPGLRFCMHPATQLMQFDHRVGGLWLAHQRGQGFGSNDTIGPERVLLTRADWSVELRVVDAAETALLTALAQGQALGEALALALECNPDADPAQLLATLVDSRAAARVLERS